jgi:shikimate dehydrogenase
LEPPAPLPIVRADVPAAPRQIINASTRYCAVFGHPVRHSASPAFQNAGITALGLNWRYLACDVHPDHLRAAIEGARRMKFIGLNLTVPHKLLAVKLVDALDASAQQWGAVNTIRFEARDPRGRWRPLRHFPDGAAPEDIRSVGFNTDADAIVRAIREDLGLNARGKRILLLGAGGAGRTAALKLAESGARELFLVNRTRAKAAAVAREIRRRFPRVMVATGYPAGETRVDLALNATSLGLRADDPLPFDGAAFSLKQARAAYDMIYRPAETPFLQLAKRAGCRTANGLGMLLWQGVAALEIWTGRRAPVAVMRRALERNVYE